MQAEATKTKPRRRRDVWVEKDDRLFTLEVFITDGPLTPAFVKKNPEISRKIEMRGDDTLDMLHFAIFDAFNRHDPHMYEYQVGGKGPMDPQARRYVLFEMMEGRSTDELKDKSIAGNVEHVTIGSLNLKESNLDEPLSQKFHNVMVAEQLGVSHNFTAVALSGAANSDGQTTSSRYFAIFSAVGL